MSHFFTYLYQFIHLFFMSQFFHIVSFYSIFLHVIVFHILLLILEHTINFLHPHAFGRHNSTVMELRVAHYIRLTLAADEKN
jgi:hypothetical protein